MANRFSHSAFPGSPLQQRDARESALAAGLRELAARHGVTLREPLQVDARGEFSVVASNGTPCDGPNDPCGCFGTFGPLLTRYSPRCGVLPGAHLDERSGWCKLHHFNAEKLLAENL